MKHIKLIAVTACVTVAFAVGHLTAQPARTTAQPAPPGPPTAEQIYMSDLAAAVKFNNMKKVVKLMDEGAGDPDLTQAFIAKMWDNAYNADPKGDRSDVLYATFAMNQRQRQIELLEQILIEMKKSSKAK